MHSLYSRRPRSRKKVKNPVVEKLTQTGFAWQYLFLSGTTLLSGSKQSTADGAFHLLQGDIYVG
jgi:hypothetical protein